MKELSTSIVSVLLAIVGVAIIAVIVSNQSQTTGVLKSGGNAFASALRCATLQGCGIGTSSSTITYGPIG